MVSSVLPLLRFYIFFSHPLRPTDKEQGLCAGHNWSFPLFAPPFVFIFSHSTKGIHRMPLDTSTTYPLTKLRLDGRRWNELRLLQAQISTNPASSGSSYLSMGNTAIMCSVHGPAEGRRGEGGGAGSPAGATVEVDVNVAGFALVDRRRRAGGSDR